MKTKKYFFMAVVLIGLFTTSGLLYATTISNPLGNITDVKVFVSSVLSFIAKIAAVFAVLALIYAGFLYVQARGNPEGLKKAHTTLKNTIIGIILLLGAELIASVITGTIGAVTK